MNFLQDFCTLPTDELHRRLSYALEEEDYKSAAGLHEEIERRKALIPYPEGPYEMREEMIAAGGPFAVWVKWPGPVSLNWMRKRGHLVSLPYLVVETYEEALEWLSHQRQA